jgi:putative ABC transport system substrate-binding protein
MNRREFTALVGAWVAALPLAAGAQQRHRPVLIGVIMNYAESDPEGQQRFSALREELRTLGWMGDGKVRLEVRWADGKADRMQAVATEFIGLPADVIVANSTRLLSLLKSLTPTIPIVFLQVADPIASGFVTNYARPGGNITGFTDFDASMSAKWIELLKEAVPAVNSASILHDPGQRNHEPFLRVIETAASASKMQVFPAAVRDEAAIEQAIAALAGQKDRGLVVLPGPVNNTNRHRIIDLVARHRLPAIYPFKYYTKNGGLVYYGTDQLEQWPKAAGYVDRILRGAKPSELPVQAPTRFELVKTAKALGLTVPASLLARADEVIE